MIRNARMLTRYNAWSNQVMYDAVAALPAGGDGGSKPQHASVSLLRTPQLKASPEAIARKEPTGGFDSPPPFQPQQAMAPPGLRPHEKSHPEVT